MSIETQKTVYSITSWVMTFLKIISVMIHIWSIVIAYNWFGLSGAIVTTFLPFISHIFLAIFLGVKAGTVFNPYIMVTIIFFAVFIATSFLQTAMMNRIMRDDPLERLRRLRF